MFILQKPARRICAALVAVVLGLLAFRAAQGVEIAEKPAEEIVPIEGLRSLLLDEFQQWKPNEAERRGAVEEVEAVLVQWIGPGPYRVSEAGLESGLRDLLTVLVSQNPAPGEDPSLGIAVLLAAACVTENTDTIPRDLVRQLRTISAEAERILYDRIRSASRGNAPLKQSDLRGFIEGRFDSQVMPYLRDPLWPMLKYPLSGEEYRRLREAVLHEVYQLQIDEFDTREDIFEDAGWILRRLPGMAVQARFGDDTRIGVRLDNGPLRFFVGQPDDQETTQAWFTDVLARFGFPRHVREGIQHRVSE